MDRLAVGIQGCGDGSRPGGGPAANSAPVSSAVFGDHLCADCLGSLVACQKVPTRIRNQYVNCEFVASSTACVCIPLFYILEPCLTSGTRDAPKAERVVVSHSLVEIMLSCANVDIIAVMTAINIPDMIKVIREHGLVPVPVDIDPHTLVRAPCLSVKCEVSVVACRRGSVDSPTRSLPVRLYMERVGECP
jgi:hypothetical protein